MSKDNKKAKPAKVKPQDQSKTKLNEKGLPNLEPWSCQHHPDHSLIEAYVMGKGDWETIAEVRASAYVNAEQLANFIIKAVNNYDRHQKLIAELASALELCLECEGITWEVEQEAGVILRRIKQDS
jgi:hypothetical protein